MNNTKTASATSTYHKVLNSTSTDFIFLQQQNFFFILHLNSWTHSTLAYFFFLKFHRSRSNINSTTFNQTNKVKFFPKKFIFMQNVFGVVASLKNKKSVNHILFWNFFSFFFFLYLFHLFSWFIFYSSTLSPNTKSPFFALYAASIYFLKTKKKKYNIKFSHIWFNVTSKKKFI